MDQGSQDFAEFYEQSRDGCFRVVLTSVGDRHQAEELVSEAFAKAWASWRKVSRHPAPQAWVVRTALNTHVSWWRRRRREVSWDGYDPVDGSGSGGQPDYPGFAVTQYKDHVVGCKVVPAADLPKK